MEYTQAITLDLNLHNHIPALRVKQGDTETRYIQVTLQKDGADYAPESGTQIFFRCQKPDGYAVLYDSDYIDPDIGRSYVIVDANGIITVELSDQVTAACGKCYCDICLQKDGQILSSLPFLIYVIERPDVASLVFSSDDFKTLTAVLKQAQALERGVQQSTGSLTLSTNWLGTESPYRQSVSVTGYDVTAHTRVDLAGDQSVLQAMTNDGVSAIFIQNNAGALTAYAFGNKPTAALTVQAFVYETQDL